MHFAEPNWLWAGAASVVGLCLLVVWSERRRSRALARFVAVRHLPALTSSVSLPRRWLRHALRVLSVACLFLALARPQWGFHFETEKREGVDVIFAVDSSKSMLARDLRPNRLTRAKLAVEELADQLPSARLGLIAFAGDAFLQTPLTADRVAFQQSLDALDTTAIPIPGTNLQSAIRVAQQAFRSEPEQRKLVVLLTDGEDLSDSLRLAARTAADSGITVHAIGVGTSTGAVIPLPEPSAGDALLRDAGGQLVHSRLDEAALRDLSQATGGSYHTLGANGRGARELYRDALTQLPKQLHDVNMRKVFHERFQWPLGLGMALLLLSLLVNEHRGRKPGRRVRLQQAAAVGGMFLCSWLTLSDAALAQDRSTITTYNGAAERYRKGDFAAAADAYRDALATPDLGLQQRAYYDLGNSLYRQGQANEPKAVGEAMERYKQAISAYESALALDAHDEDARYNRDFVRAKLKQLEQQAQQKSNQAEDRADSSGADKKGKDANQGGSISAAESGGSQRDQAQTDSAQGERAAPSGDPGQAGNPNAEERQGDPREGHAQGKQPADGKSDPHDGHEQAEQPADGQPREAHAQAEQPAEGEPTPEVPQPHQGEPAGAEDGSAATAARAQPRAAAMASALTHDQAARLLDSLEGELRQLPSGSAAPRVDSKQEEQARKDW
ncbi:MAG TPA: VWA domain-containing protein [Polyangiales bacterium]|nr:VWA domain-containing protein [Polyangiales bacterium]